jgi:RIO kinase 1
MKAPKQLQPLIADGVIDEVISRLMSGKEADLFIVSCGGRRRCAKLYKDAVKRSFKKAAQYSEGRKVRNSRRARAMEKGSRYGRQQQESLWQNAEVDALYRLQRAGVRVPEPYGCFDGVLLMELIVDESGDVAPRLNDVTMSAEQAREDHALVMHYVKCMLSEGLIHGDLSEFNVLVNEDGPVIIDLPQAVNASGNNNAQAMLQRDVRNVTAYYSQFAPELAETRYAEEMWSLYEDGDLHADTPLSGEFADATGPADTAAVMAEIRAVLAEEEARQRRQRIAQGLEEAPEEDPSP